MKISNIAKLPTKFGSFNMLCVLDELGIEHAVLIKGNIHGQENVTLRVHSECITGDVFSSLKCDCGQQLEETLSFLSEQNYSILIYLRQEGRGIGLFNKINAYNLQDKGWNTIEANLELGFANDERDYKIVAEILAYLEIQSVNLLTNNPDKVSQISSLGVKINNRIPLVIIPNSYNEDYLKIKKEQMNHLI